MKINPQSAQGVAVQHTRGADVPGAAAPADAKKSTAEKSGGAQAAGDSIQLSEQARDLFQHSVLKATGADQFLDWNSWKSHYASISGVERGSKESVLEKLRALLDGEDGQGEQKLIIAQVIERMEAVEQDANHYRPEDTVQGQVREARAFEKSLDGLTPEQKIQARQERAEHVHVYVHVGGRDQTLSESLGGPESGDRAFAEFAAENPSHEAVLTELHWSGNEMGYAYEPPVNYGVQRTPEEAEAAHRAFQAEFGEGNRRELAAREREEAEGVTPADAYVARLKRALGRSPAFWGNVREHHVQSLKVGNEAAKAQGEPHLSPAELDKRTSGLDIDWRADYQRRLDLMERGSAVASLTRQLRARFS